MKFLSSRRQDLAYYLLIATTASFLLSLSFMQLFVAILILLWLIDRDRFAAFDNISKLFAVYVIARVITVFTSEYSSMSLPALYKEALFYLGFFAMSFHIKKLDFRRKETLIEVLVYVAVVVSLIGISLFVLNVKHRAQSYFAGYGTFSTFLLLAFAFFFYLAKNKKQVKRLYIVLMGSIILTGIILALSRTDIAVAVMVIIGALFFRKITFPTMALILIVSALFSTGAFLFNSSELKVRVSQPATMSDRDIIWGRAFEAAGEHPFLGFGPRTFDKVFNKRDQLLDKGVGGWHNDFIALYIESGIIGLSAFLLFAVYLLRVNFAGYLKNRSFDRHGTFYWVTYASLLACIISAMFSGFITNPILSIVFAFSASLMASEAFPMKKEVRNP